MKTFPMERLQCHKHILQYCHGTFSIYANFSRFKGYSIGANKYLISFTSTVLRHIFNCPSTDIEVLRHLFKEIE